MSLSAQPGPIFLKIQSLAEKRYHSLTAIGLSEWPAQLTAFSRTLLSLLVWLLTLAVASRLVCKSCEDLRWNGIHARLVLHCLLFLLPPCVLNGTLNRSRPFVTSTGRGQFLNIPEEIPLEERDLNEKHGKKEIGDIPVTGLNVGMR